MAGDHPAGYRPIDRMMRWLFTARVGPGLIAAGGALAFLAVLTSGRLFNDGDTYWHLATGRWILEHQAVPRVDSFSYTFAGRPWHAHEWLSELIMWSAFAAGGWNGLQLLFAGAFGVTAVAIGRAMSRWLAVGPWMLALGLGLAVGAPSFLARPHLLALPFLAIWLAELLAARQARRAPSPWLLVVMLAWANMHGSYVLGLGLAGVFGLEALLATWRSPRRTLVGWGVFGLALIAVGLANPFGLSGLMFPLQVQSMSSLPMISEWRSPDFSRLRAFEIAILLTLFACLWRGVRVPPLRLIVLLGFLHLALAHMRHQMVFGVVAALLLAEPIARAAAAGIPQPIDRAGKVSRGLTFAALAVVLAAGAWRMATPSVRVDGLNVPISALAAVPPDLAKRPVFNAYGMGGYLIFKGVRPYVDGRGDMYGDAFLRTYMLVTRPKLAALREELDRRSIDWVIVTAGEPVVGALDGMPEWRRLHSDHYAAVFVRRTAADALNLADAVGPQGPGQPGPASRPR